MIYLAIRLDEREMNGGASFGDIDWTSLGAVVEGFKDRLRWYYLDAANALRKPSRQFDHVIMAVACLLIDTLAQFHFGTPSSLRVNFISFLALYVPAFNAVLPISIEHQNDPAQGLKTVTRYSDVLYRGFRCGILHEAIVLPYGALGTGALLAFEAVGLSEYDGTVVAARACPTVRFDAWLVCDSVQTALDDYCARLLDPLPVNNHLRNNFRDKFRWSYGVDITGAVL